jgi:hypothetical protein
MREIFFSKKRTVPLNNKKPLRKDALKSMLNNMVDFSEKYIKTASGPIKKYTSQEPPNIQDSAHDPGEKNKHRRWSKKAAHSHRSEWRAALKDMVYSFCLLFLLKVLEIIGILLYCQIPVRDRQTASKSFSTVRIMASVFYAGYRRTMPLGAFF